MLDYAAQVLIIVFITFFATVFQYWLLNTYKSVLIAQKLPLRLAYYSLVWTVGVLTAFMLWSKYGGKKQSGIITSTSWFNIGYKMGLTFLSVPIDAWWKYLIVVNYQVTRNIIGSLLQNIFRPFMLAEVQSKMNNKTIDRSQTVWILLAQSSVTIFGFVSSITDLFLFLSQIDLSIVSLVITLISDAASTNAVLQAGAQSESYTQQEIEDKVITRDTEGLLTRRQSIASSAELKL